MTIPTLKPVEKTFVPDHRHQYRADSIRQLSKTTVESVMQIGKHLIEAKSIIPHGYWEKWLDDEFGWSKSTAERYMRIHQAFESVTVTDLENIDLSALYLLCKRTTERKVREEALRQARIGQHVTKSHAEKLIEWSKRPLPAPPKRSKEQIRADDIARAGNEIVNCVAGLYVAFDVWPEEGVSIDDIAGWLATSDRGEGMAKMLAALPVQLQRLSGSLDSLTNVVRFAPRRKGSR